MSGESRRVRSQMLDDVPGTCVGGMRRLEVGDMILVQQLDAVDDEEHRLKYHAVDHPSNRWDPPGSFVNDRWTISMKAVTLGNNTHVDMSGKFYTEPENAAAMSEFIGQMCQGVITGVQTYLEKAEAAGLLRPRSRILGWQQPFNTPAAHLRSNHSGPGGQFRPQPPVGMPQPMSHPMSQEQARLMSGFNGAPRGQPSHHGGMPADHTPHHQDYASHMMGGYGQGMNPQAARGMQFNAAAYPHAPGFPGYGMPGMPQAQQRPVQMHMRQEYSQGILSRASLASSRPDTIDSGGSQQASPAKQPAGTVPGAPMEGRSQSLGGSLAPHASAQTSPTHADTPVQAGESAQGQPSSAPTSPEQAARSSQLHGTTPGRRERVTADSVPDLQRLANGAPNHVRFATPGSPGLTEPLDARGGQLLGRADSLQHVAHGHGSLADSRGSLASLGPDVGDSRDNSFGSSLMFSAASLHGEGFTSRGSDYAAAGLPMHAPPPGYSGNPAAPRRAADSGPGLAYAPHLSNGSLASQIHAGLPSPADMAAFTAHHASGMAGMHLSQQPPPPSRLQANPHANAYPEGPFCGPYTAQQPPAANSSFLHMHQMSMMGRSFDQIPQPAGPLD